MARLKVGKLIDGLPAEVFDFEVHPFFGLYLGRPGVNKYDDKFYWRIGNSEGTQLLSFDVFKGSGLISGVELITFSGKQIAFDGLNPARKKSDANLVLIRESAEDHKSSKSIVDATDYLHDISFSVSGNKIRLGFYDTPPVQEIQLSPSLSLLIDSADLVAGVEIGNLPAEEIGRMTRKL